MDKSKRASKPRVRVKVTLPVELPALLARIPDRPAGHEIAGQEARDLIERFAQEHWGIDWSEWRRRWNDAHHEEDNPDAFTNAEKDQMRDVARLLQYAVMP